VSAPARYLKAIRHRPGLAGQSGFPFDLPIVSVLDGLSLVAPVTFLVGENGCGKSTILEAMAAGMRAVAAGAADLSRDTTLKPARAGRQSAIFQRTATAADPVLSCRRRLRLYPADHRRYRRP